MTKNEKETLLGAYLVVGEDELKRQRVLSRLRSRVAKLGDLEFNHDEFDGEKATGTEIAAACNTLPFASDLRLVEVKAGEKLRKADQEVLIAYLAAPSTSTVLAFSASKLAKNTKLYKAFASIGKSAVIDCTPMKRYELVRALRSMAVGHGFTLTESGAIKLVELVGEDTVHLDGELQKLALATQGNNALTDRDVEALVARTSEAKPWELVDAFSARDLSKALHLLSITEDAPLKHLSLCVARLRELACAKSLAARGESANLASVLGVPPWRVKNHGRWASNFSESELIQAFSSARDCEKILKTTSFSRDAFIDWMISVIA